MFKKYIILVLIIILVCFVSLQALAQEETGDEEIFSSVAPDVLIVMDVTGSMAWNPASGSAIWSNDPNCAGGFNNSGTGTNCSRIEIAKRAIFAILDDDHNGIINTQDSNSLGIRIGFMTFSGDDTGLDWNSGGIRLRRAISVLGSTASGTPYQTTYCGVGTNNHCHIDSTGNTSTVAGQSANGGTPLTSALREAKTYLDLHKEKDIKAYTCRKKFVILLSDGADTYICNGDGAECPNLGHMYKRRRMVVAAAKQLNDAGYKVYVVGFGAGMKSYLKSTLNWMAYYGGTDNPETNVGPLPPDVQGYQMDTSGCQPFAIPPVTTTCCNIAGAVGSETTTGICFASGITSCQEDTTTYSATCYDPSAGTTTNFRAQHNDPGYYNWDHPTLSGEDNVNLEGFAFIAGNTSQLVAALRTALTEISASSYSFTQASVQTVRTVDENFLYEASFTPVVSPPDSFWPGHLKRFKIIDALGHISASADWDAGTKLEARSAADRKVYTLTSTGITEFTNSNFSLPADFGIYTGTAADQEALRALCVKYIREGEQGGANVGCKLGDIFHSSPITIGTPNEYFYDRIDQNNPKGFSEFRDNHIRTTALGNRLIVAGANDAQFHVFKASDTDGGAEVWSFLPPNFLTRLTSVAHTSVHPAVSGTHQYFMDGEASASDVWWGTDQTHKQANEWHTLLVTSEGRGGSHNLWSSSASCNTGTCDDGSGNLILCDDYSSTNNHYCGYYAFDITDTSLTTPQFAWKLGGTGGVSLTQGPYLGQPWSKMTIGRILYNSVETWVGFVGGGFSKSDCSGGGPSCSPEGKGFFVVKTEDGSILWSYTMNDNPTDMVYDLAGQAAVIDYDNDGFLDTAYIADTGGNVWRFRFCLGSNPTCTPDASLLYRSAGGPIRPIYTKPAVSRDPAGNIWVYFGTGDATDPTAPNAQEQFYAVMDTERNGTYDLNDLKSLASGSTFDLATEYPAKHGWRFLTPGSGEKILSNPIIFFGVVYFTTYTPSNSNNLCEKTGDIKLYGVDYISGAGQMTGGSRSEDIGQGTPGSPQGSFDPGTGNLNIYYGTQSFNPPTPPGLQTNVLYWHDTRVQP